MTSCMHIILTARRADKPDDLSVEQIYLVATSIDLRPWPPAVDVRVYGPKGGVCTARMGNTTSRSQADARSDLDAIRPHPRQSFGRPNGMRASLARPEDVIFLVALMEHLNGSPSVVRSLVLRAVGDALQIPAGKNKNGRVATLIDVMNRTIDFANGGPNFCSAIELGLTSRDIWLIESNGYLQFNRPFAGYGGCYNVGVTVCMKKHLSVSALLQGDYEFSEESWKVDSPYVATTHLQAP